MCGRYVSSKNPEDLVEVYEAEKVQAEDRGAQYNVAPTTGINAVLDRSDKGLITIQGVIGV